MSMVQPSLVSAVRPSGVGEIVLGGEGRAGCELAVLALDQPIEAELRGRFHQRVGPRAEKLAIAGERVVLPEMLAEPRAAHLPVGPGRRPLPEVPDRRGLAPDVHVVVRDPAAASVIHHRGFRTSSC